MLQAIVTSNLLLIFPFPLSQSSQVTFLLNFFKAQMEPAGCKEVGRTPHTPSTADVNTPLSHSYLVRLPFCFLASGTVIFPLGLTCHFEHYITACNYPLTTRCQHWQVLPAQPCCKAALSGTPGTSWVRLCQGNTMSKSKLLLCRHSSCFALGTVQTDTVRNNTCILWQTHRQCGGDWSQWILFSAGFHSASP